MKKKIWLSSPHLGGGEMKYIEQAMEGNWVAPLGPNVDAFENELSAFTGSPNVAALSSGTAAIHLALIILGVKRSDEVICSSLTFSASTNPILYEGAMPVFIDSERATWNLSPQNLEDAIKDRIKRGKKPKAIIAVHLYGMCAMMNEIMEIANHFEIPVIEDAAEALGSTYQKKHSSSPSLLERGSGGEAAGTFGKIGCLSFNGNKIITTSGGGALMSDEKWITEKAKFLATQAREIAPHYEHKEIGFNYRMSNILAGIGRGQMEVLPLRIEQRRKVYARYVEQLSSISEIRFLPEPEGTFSNRWLTCILIDRNSKISREDIRIALEKENVDARPLWKPMHLQPVFKDYPYYGSGVCADLFERGLCLPSGSNLEEKDQEMICSVIRKLFAS